MPYPVRAHTWHRRAPRERVDATCERAGQEARVTELLGRLSESYAGRPGFIQGYVLHPLPDGATTRRLERVGIWATEEDAEAAGQRAIALRSELLALVDEDSHVELAFEGKPDLHYGAASRPACTRRSGYARGRTAPAEEPETEVAASA